MSRFSSEVEFSEFFKSIYFSRCSSLRIQSGGERGSYSDEL